MAADYRTYTFLVEIVGTAGPVVVGGFSECSGLADTSAPRASFTRGAVNTRALAPLLAPGARAQVQVTMRGETGAVVHRWRLDGARIVKYAGPTLSAKGTDVAMEELSLTADGIASA